MDLLHGVLLVAAGIAGGIMAAIVGGAAVITFPALLAAGLPPVMATAANTVALTPGLFLAAIYDRSQLPPFDRSFVAVALASIVGAADRRRAAAADPGTGVLGAGAAAARLRDRAVRLCRADQHVARRPRRHPRQRAPLHPFPGGGAAGLGLWRLFRRRPRGAHARRAVGRDRRQLSLRQRHQEPGDRVEQRDRHRDLCGARARCRGRRRC